MSFLVEIEMIIKVASLLLPLAALGILTVDYPRVNNFLIKVVGAGVVALAIAVFLQVWGFV